MKEPAPGIPSINKDKTETDVSVKKETKKFEFRDLAEMEEYLEWKKNIPREVGNVVEAIITNNPPSLISSGFPLSDQFLNSLGKSLQEGVFTQIGEDQKIKNLLEPLAKIETRAGFLNVFEMLKNPDVSWNLKRKLYETQLKPSLEWLHEQDLKKLQEAISKTAEDEEKEDKSQESSDSDIPLSDEKVMPGVDEKEKKEGAPKALFTVTPFYGGYARQLIFENFNPQTLEWEPSPHEFEGASALSAQETLGTRILFGKARGGSPMALPIYYNWGADASNIVTNAPEGSVEILQNENGQYFLKINAEGVFSYQLRIASEKTVKESEVFHETNVEGVLPTELKEHLDELKAQKLPKMKLARETVKLVRNNLIYSNEDYSFYYENPARYFERIWERKKANCYFSNTLAVRALKEVGLKVRFVGGYFIKDKNEKGEAIMHAGNGHAWLEVYDGQSRRWVRLDATPKGDPTVDEGEQEKDLEGGEGDYGEGEDELMSEKELQEKIREMKKQQGGGGREKLQSHSRLEEQFAELAECTSAQAKEFLKALERVREIKDERGISISDLMLSEWKKIVEERKIETNEYQGPVRMNDGDRLDDPVAAYMDVKSKEFNPTGFEKDRIIEKKESHFGGINIFFSFDLSGSMAGPDSASGRSKADVQRDSAFLFIDSLMQCAYINRQYGKESELLPLKIMATLASNRGEVKLHLTDKWTPKEQWALYKALTQIASGGTPTHETLELIEKDFDKEQRDLKKKKIPPHRMPINYVVEISDGAPDSPLETEAMHKKLKEKGAVIRSYLIGTASSSEDASTVSSFSELPKILLKDITEQFRKLRPNKIRI